MIAQETATPTREELRSHFPALASGFAFLENAGGAQAPAQVINGIADYFKTSYVQLDAGYSQSDRATKTAADAHAFAEIFMGAEDKGKAILGPSSTALINILANAYALSMQPGTRIIAAETGHEANVGPWANLAERGFDFQIWRVNKDTFQCHLAELEDLLRPGNTKIVAFPHVSNLLGEVVDVEAITRLAHKYGARVVVDGVAYAPHRLVEVAKWGVDYYCFSWYKVYGPHMAALFGTHEALAEIEGPNHFFIPNDTAYKFELGGVSHEGCAGLLGLSEYLRAVAGDPHVESFSRGHAIRAAATMTELELPLQERYIGYLNAKPGVRVIGPSHSKESRVTTISFVHERLSPPEIVSRVHKHPVGIRYGNAYAYRLCEAIGLDPATGVVRASFVHYNTLEEVERLISGLDEALA